MVYHPRISTVNKALKAAGFDVEIVKDDGYYWFDDETTQIPSIYEYRLSGSVEVIVEHVRKSLEDIKNNRY